jgi:hypothetical protein
LRSNIHNTWYDWQFALVGKYLEKDGPDDAAMLAGQELFQALNLSEIAPTPKLKARASTPAPTPTPTPPKLAPSRIHFTTGFEREEAPPPEAYDGPNDF